VHKFDTPGWRDKAYSFRLIGSNDSNFVTYKIIDEFVHNEGTYEKSYNNIDEFKYYRLQSTDDGSRYLIIGEIEFSYIVFVSDIISTIYGFNKSFSSKTLIIDAGVDGYLNLSLNNGELICGSSNYNDPGTHGDLRSNYPHVYFGHRACLIGKDENNLEEWNISNNNHYEIPFNVNGIKSIELIYCGRNIEQTDENKYLNRYCSLTLNDNTIIIIDDAGSSSEYKFKIIFN